MLSGNDRNERVTQLVEIWKKINGYESYEISNCGRVKNKQGKLIVQPKDKDGYRKVSLCKNSKQKTHFVHRLVALTFIPNHREGDTVDHKNNIKDDNRVENLQWMKRRDNVQKFHKEQNHVLHELGHKRWSGLKRGETRRIPINQYDKNGNFLASYVSMMDAERSTGIGNGDISMCVNGIRSSAGGYIWKKKLDDMDKPERENRG